MAIYMKYGEEIKGDATQAGYEGWINLSSFDWGLERHFAGDQTGRALNREASQAQVKRCHVTKDVDHSSGAILKTVATHFKSEKCTIVFVRTGNPGEAYLTFTLTDALISNLAVSSGSPERPTEKLEIDFTELEIECKTLAEDNTSEENMRITYSTATGVGS
jgi:type VI secretion system secreted protein Hcp